MDPYANRTYRNFAVGGTTAYRVTQGESDLFIRTVGEHRQVAERALAEVRRILTDHLAAQPAFATSLTPLDVPASAPPLIGSMAQASREAGVGPMAAVAGAVAQAVGEALTDHSPQVLVENGGDVYLKLTDDFTIGLVAGDSPFSGRVGLVVSAAQTPLGICTSAGTYGHSYSAGRADAAVVLAANTCLADAVATAMGNRVRDPNDAEAAVDFALRITGILGAVVVIGDTLAVRGDVQLEKLVSVKE